jgi:hypothetical protein
VTPLGPLASKSGMEHLVENENPTGIYYFGEKSVIANWAINHPILIIAILAGVCCLITIDDKVMLSRVTIYVLPYLFAMAFLVKYLCRNLCYVVEIDMLHQTIRFYQCYKKGFIEAPLSEVEFCFDIIYGCHYMDKNFTIMTEYIFKIISILPDKKNIKFADHFWGRYAKKQYEKSRFFQNLPS